MTNSISKATMMNDIWKNFYDRIRSQVTSVSITSDPYTVTIQTYTEAFPDKKVELPSQYPICIINYPLKDSQIFTFGKTQASFIIDIEIYTTQAQSADKFQDALDNAIETYRRDIDIVSTDSEMFQRGEIKLHRRLTRWKMNYVFPRTTTW
jgi:hypothetical protein